MIIHGKERGFFLSTAATLEIAKMCPDEDIKNIGEIMKGSFADISMSGAKIIVIMNTAYEKDLMYNDPGHKVDPLTVEEVLDLDMNTFREAEAAALKAFKADSRQTVEVEPEKKEEAPL